MAHFIRKMLNSVLGGWRYQYRGLPMYNHATESYRSVYVLGVDCVQGGVGILEWCNSIQDAKRVVGLMQADRFRFKNITIYYNHHELTDPLKPIHEWARWPDRA